MRHCLAIVLLVAATGVPAAEAYRWVDDKGVVNYGEKAPPNRPARPVNTEPTGVIETGDPSGPKGDAGQADEPRGPRVIAVPVPVPSPAPAGPLVRGMEFDTFIRLQAGMTEGELLVRAGRPDYESLDNLGDYDRSYYYFPTAANPYTTVVRLRSGRIVNMDRIKKF
jgi:uncharacterized protein DUF4124